MSIRRFNYTERQRLHTSDVAIYLDEESASSYSFDAIFDLARYRLPPNAQIIVEAYRQTIVRRYAFGRVANPSAEGPTDLGDFRDSSGVLFRAKVVDPSGSGRLLAAADRLHTADSKTANRRSLIRVASAPLDGEIWRFSIDMGEPLLEVEQKFARESLLNSPHFICLVYPQIVRELLRRALDDDPDDEDETSWQSKAVSFGERLSGKKAPENVEAGDDARDDWIEAVVTTFCKRHHLVRKYGDIDIDGESDV